MNDVTDTPDSPALEACSAAYQAIDFVSRQPMVIPPAAIDLVRYATLAANAHNTQPWIFRPHRTAIVVAPDFTRRTPVVDPDDHHLYASLGCAVENLSLAARAYGHSGEVVWEPGNGGGLRVDLGVTSPQCSPLFHVIPFRQVSRALYKRSAVAIATLKRLEQAGSFHGVETRLITDVDDINGILDLAIEANSLQIDDPAFVAELQHWLRFNPRSAIEMRDGLYAPCFGNPEVPDWLAPTMFRLLFNTQRENDKLARHIRSSSGIAVFIAAHDTPNGWIDVGRAYERFALQTTLEGLSHAFINQATEVAPIRRELRALLAIGERRPSLLVRFGYGPAMPHSLRRPPDAVML